MSYIDRSRGPGVWYRVKDLYHCRAGDFIWDFVRHFEYLYAILQARL